MPQITDNSGKSWSLMSCKDSAGRVYIRAYRNRWDAEKKRSCVDARIQVGRLLDDGSIRLSSAFEQTFSSFQGQTWYWADRELVSQQQFEQLFPVKKPKKDISWSDETIRVGVTYAAWKTAEKMKILDDLTAVFGEEKGRYLLALAAYKLDGGGAMMNFEDWVAQVWLPDIEPRDGRRISELLAKLTVTQFEEYYKKRYDRANERQAGAVTLSFDCTSISTYSTTITDAAWGHAKQNPELRQVNYMVVCDHASGDVVYAYAYDGSINDKAILPTIYLQMQSANLSLKDNILVTDRGFQSIYNTQKAINLKLKYIQFLNLNEGAVRAQLRRNAKALKDPIAHNNPRMGICGVRVADHWTEQTEDGYQLQLEAHLHLYRDAVVAQTEADDLYRDVLDVVDRKNEEVQRQRDQEKLVAEATEKAKELGNTKEAKALIDKAKKEAEKLSKQAPIDPVLWKRVRRYLRENKKAKPTELVWSVNFDELKKAVEFMGCRAIRSNVESDPFKALQIYRQREIIERGFDQLKNEVGGSRLEATEATYRGKLFIYTIAQALRMSMLCTARKISDQNPSLKMPEESLRKLLGQLRSVQARKHRTTDAFIVGAVAKRHRDLLDLLGIEKLPGYLYR